MKKNHAIMIVLVCINVILRVCLFRYVNHSCYEELYKLNLNEIKESLSEYTSSYEKLTPINIIDDTGMLVKLAYKMDKPFKRSIYSLYDIIKLHPETLATRIKDFTEIIEFLNKGDELNAEVKIDELLNELRLDN